MWEEIRRQAARAAASGALHKIETTAAIIDDGGIAFVVRCATQLKKEDAAKAAGAGDPFARPEPDLFVADVSATHFALLNKYNVLECHLLLVTREDIDQDEPLDEADFEALALCMADQPVLGFYNGGAAAGASQRHKHLQVVRLPLSPGRAIPMEALIENDALGRVPFRHAFARLGHAGDPSRQGQALLARYRALCEAMELRSQPYNLLVTRDWMLLVPRTRASFEGIPANSLAFAGALFVRDEDELRTVERLGPMAVLRGVALPKDPT